MSAPFATLCLELTEIDSRKKPIVPVCRAKACLRLAALVAIAWVAGLGSSMALAGVTITVAADDDIYMTRMQGLLGDFKARHPDIEVEWQTLRSDVLRSRGSGGIRDRLDDYDVVMLNHHDVKLWAREGLLQPLDQFGEDYDEADLIPPVREALTVDDQLYAAPLRAEGALLYYRRDLLAAAGILMPASPDWAFVAESARALTDPQQERYGICLDGKAGWAENMATLTALANAFGTAWFDVHWRAQFDQPLWREVMLFYNTLLNEAAPPDSSSHGAAENLQLFREGQCAMWFGSSAAVAALLASGEISDKQTIGFAPAPHAGKRVASNWLWVRALAVPQSSSRREAAQQFIAWATSKHYLQQVAANGGLVESPPAARSSLYSDERYMALPFAALAREAVENAATLAPTADPVPYDGIQFVLLPEYQGIANAVGQQFSAALAGTTTLEQALENAQKLCEREMREAGYFKD